MKRVELGPGVHRLAKITEPTHIIGSGWTTILKPLDDGNHALVASAPLRVSNLVATGAEQMGIQVYDEQIGKHPPFEGNNLWVHSNGRSGINATGSVRLHRSLVERNGVHPHYHHGVYAGDGDVWLSNCILWQNAGAQLCSVEPSQVVILDQNLIGGGKWPLYITNVHPETLHLRRNTINGPKCVLVGASLSDPNYPIPENNLVNATHMVDRSRRLYWPLAENHGRGAYDYDPAMTVEHAKTLWHHGHMFAYDGWDYGDNALIRPLFPGDAVPVLKE